MSRIIGIDLGTSTSEAAVIKDGVPFVIPNHIGEAVTPSAIHITPDGGAIIGTQARERLLTEPECTFIEVKRRMGASDPLTAHGKSYSPELLSSYILRYLAECAESYLGEKVTGAVITVPAYFTNEQRRATMEAGRLAGLTVERIINEPTAAALSYGLAHMGDCKNILVYDLGGGTLDVTALELFEGVIEVRASSGNNHLGGKDFDEALISHLLNTFNQRHQVYIQNDPRAMARLKEAAERCKIALSEADEHTIELPFLMNIKDKPVSLRETIRRETLEALVGPMIESTEEQIRAALSDAGMRVSDVDLTLLVGGSTRIPYVRRMVERVMGKKPALLVDPDLAVVHGAAAQAGIIERLFVEDEPVLTDVCPYTLGTAVLRNDPLSFLYEDVYFDPIITRNAAIPVTSERTYATCARNQTQVEIKVYQGEYNEPERNNFLGEVSLTGIPPGPAGKEKIIVAFSYDINGILQVEAKIASTGAKADITISTQEKQMVKEVDTARWKDAKRAKKYSAVIRKAEKIAGEEPDDDLEDLIRALKTGLVNELPDDELGTLKDELIEYLLDLEE